MILKKQHLQLGLVLMALTGCDEQADQSTVSTDQVTGDAFIAQADSHTKLIALRGPKWSKPDLTYALSACWKFASGGNISYGRGTCALVNEELELPSYNIDVSTENPMNSCYLAAQTAKARVDDIQRAMDEGLSALDAIAHHNATTTDLADTNEFFTECKQAFPALSREVELVQVTDYAAQAAKLMPSRKKREDTEALGTAASIIWPDEQP